MFYCKLFWFSFYVEIETYLKLDLLKIEQTLYILEFFFFVSLDTMTSKTNVIFRMPLPIKISPSHKDISIKNTVHLNKICIVITFRKEIQKCFHQRMFKFRPE